MISIILVGIGEWERYTFPAIESIRKHEPNVEYGLIGEGDYRLVVMDNDNHYSDVAVIRKRVDEPAGFVQFVVSNEIISYAAAINFAIERVPKSDYYIILNNDVICTGPFVQLVESQPKNVIGANTLNFRGDCTWVDGWHYCIPHWVWERVGPFDEAFQAAAFEDADYTFRAQRLGINIIQTHHPFIHLWSHNRYKVSRFWEQREQNKQLLIKKHPEYRKVFNDYN